jgi:hypothetical protein
MSLAYSSGEEGGILLVQMISTGLGGGVSTLCVKFISEYRVMHHNKESFPT